MTDRLNPGEFIERNSPNNKITSANGKYTLIMQDDGNLVIYNNHQGKPLWATGTDGTDCKQAIMQDDGNFVLYHVNGKPEWATGTNGRPGCHIIMQDDGNLVIYQPVVPVWASNTVGG